MDDGYLIQPSFQSTHPVRGGTNERGVSEGDIVNALTTPLRIGKIRMDMSQQFIGEKATVVLNTETGKSVTVWPTSANRAQKLKGGS